MLRKNIVTALWIMVAFALAALGWMVTNHLISMESNRLLSGTTAFAVSIPILEPALPEDDYEHPGISGVGLTSDEMVSVLQNWELVGYRRPHETAPGQIDMETAIILGRAGLRFLHDHNILPEAVEYSNPGAGAFLSQNIPSGEFMYSRYSYWTVNFHSNMFAITMIINAVTGQIWSIEILSRLWRDETQAVRPDLGVSANDIKEALSVFVSDLGLTPVSDGMHGILVSPNFEESGYIVPPSQYWRYPDRVILEPRPWIRDLAQETLVGQRIADDQLRVEISATGMIVPDGMLFYSGLWIRLIARPPVYPIFS